MILSSVAFCDDHRPPGRVIPEIPILEPGSAGGLGLIDATSNAGVFLRSCAETRAQTEQTMRRTPHAVLMRESYASPSLQSNPGPAGYPGITGGLRSCSLSARRGRNATCRALCREAVDTISPMAVPLSTRSLKAAMRESARHVISEAIVAKPILQFGSSVRGTGRAGLIVTLAALPAVLLSQSANPQPTQAPKFDVVSIRLSAEQGVIGNQN